MDACRRHLLVLTLALAAGCATKPGKAPAEEWEHPQTRVTGVARAPTERIAGHPAIGETTTVEVGRNMLSVSRITTAPTLQLASSFPIYIKHGGETIEFLVNAGTLRLWGYGENNSRFFTNGKLRGSYEQRTKGVYKFDHMANGGVMLDAEGRAYVYWQWDDYPMFYRPAPQAQFKEADEIQSSASGGIRRELVYTGISDNTVNILYREFTANDMARPAFSQDLRYDISKSRNIGYQGARIEIVAADNIGITYRVLSHLDSRAN